MTQRKLCRGLGHLGLYVAFALGLGVPAVAAQTASPASPSSPASNATPKSVSPPQAAPATPEAKSPPASATPSTPTTPPAPITPPGPPAPAQPSKQLAPAGKPQTNEIEPNATPTVPGKATTESVEVPARPIVLIKGTSTYDDAFKSIKASLETLKVAMDKAGLKPTGHPITIFSAPSDKGFMYEAAVPIAAQPAGKADLGGGVTFGMSPSGSSIKFLHRGPYDDIDSTYDVITAYLDAKGLQVDNPYIEEYLGELTTPDDPNLEVDIYVFVKK